jgi:hypothetical protein
MKAIVCHITINGRPLCAHGNLLERENVTCSYRSVYKARKSYKKLRRNFHDLKIVKGECPA